MEASQVDLENCSDELRAAHELAAAASAAVWLSQERCYLHATYCTLFLFYFKFNFIFLKVTCKLYQ